MAGQTISNKLIVEGADDAAFFSLFLTHLGIDSCEIISAGGQGNVFTKLTSEINNQPKNNPASLRIGMILDADGNAESKFKDYSNRIEQSSLGITPPEGIGIFSPFQPRKEAEYHVSVGIYISPVPNEGEMLEDLCLSSIEEPFATCLSNYLTCCHVTKDKDYSKRKFRIFLETYDTINKEKSKRNIRDYDGKWNFDHPNLATIKGFLEGFR